jgi:hypothetical protein
MSGVYFSPLPIHDPQDPDFVGEYARRFAPSSGRPRAKDVPKGAVFTGQRYDVR